MPVFFSENGMLSEPEIVHAPTPGYESVVEGKPLCVEILHVGFGNVRDLLGKSEVLISSWAKLGGTGSPGPRVINVMRTGVQQFDDLSDFGSADYGNPLVFYTPCYKGERLRLSIELLEIDKLKKDGIKSLGDAMRGLSSLAVFAPQLAYMTFAPNVLELARKLYNLINRNDQVLLEHVDLAFNEPDLKVLSSGRFVIVDGNQRASKLLEEFRLSAGSRLVTSDGKRAEDAGMASPYVVIRINAREFPEYREFAIEHAAQEKLAAFLNNEMIAELAEFVHDGVAATAHLDAIENLIVLKKKLDITGTDVEREEIIEQGISEVRRLPEDLKDLVLSILLPQN
ncbi:MAG: hypothetical protein JW941_12860 [Candidatus Coatesbacteria bacterium]|nr:hypothetical protein [Candidatus Coatesbacteria bacterium]